MALPQLSTAEGVAEALAPTQLSHQLANLGRDQPLVWEELPKSTLVKCLADSKFQWMELPRVSPGAGRMSSDPRRTDMSQSELKSPNSVAQSRVQPWPSEPLWDEEQTAKQILPLPAPKEDGRTSKDMFGLVQACPRQATCPGLPSVFEDREEKWIFGEEPLGSLKKELPQRAVRVDSSIPGQEHMGTFSLLASCPKRSAIWGFPSLQEPRRRPPPASVLHLLPLCPTVSAIAGFASAEGFSKAGWVAEAGWLIFSQPKKPECRIFISPSSCPHPGSVYALAPSCPRRSKTPGFPSVPIYGMLTLLPLWPKTSSVPGCGSEGYQGPLKGLWPCQLHTLFNRPTKAMPSVAYRPDRCGASVKNMFRLTPCCPEACRTPGFPMVGFAAVSLVHCCSGNSRTEGLGPAAPGTGWAGLAKAILMSTREKEAEMLAPFAGQQQEHGHSMKNMATSCPKESRVHGCPSAPPVDRPPNMISLYGSASCSPRIPGFPSSRTFADECVPKQPRVKAFLQRPLKDRKTFKCARLGSALQREADMAAMTPSCPRVAANPGFPSVCRLSPSDGEAAGETLT